MELRGKFEHKWDPPPKTNPPKMKYPPHHGLYKSYEIVAGPRPLPTTSTLAIHTLCGKPLSTPFGKKILAKELGSWYGFRSQTQANDEAAGYYVRSGRHRRYIMLDGFDSPNVYNTMQSYDFGSELDLFTDFTCECPRFCVSFLHTALTPSYALTRIIETIQLSGGPSQLS